MKCIAYFLVFLTFWAQFDDVLLISVLPFQSAPLSSDDNEYVSSGSQEQREWLVPRRQLQSVSVRLQVADFPLVRRAVPSEWNLTTPFASPLLYVFMSLQI